MVRLIGRTSLRRSPRSHQAKKYLNKGASVLYIGSTDISNPASKEELNICIAKLMDEKYSKIVDTKIFINSQDYLRVVSCTSGKILFCVPVDVIVTCICAHEKYIAFSASTSLNPNSNTIHMAHVFECASERQVEELYDALLRTIDYVHSQEDFRDDTSKVAPQFSKLSVEKTVHTTTSSVVMYHSSFQPDSINLKPQPSREDKLAITNHALFRKAFEYMKQGNQEKLHAVIYSEIDILCADDAGQTLLHLSVKLDKFSACKFLLNQCCKSDAEKVNLRCAKDKEGMTALHIGAIYGLKNFVKFLATDFKAVNMKDIKGRTPLHYCAGKIMHREMTHILVDHGSQIEVPELDGIKPISIEPALQKIQELSVSGAFVFINNLNFMERASKRIDSGVDIACSEKTASEPEIMLVHSPDSCYSPRQDNSLSSIPEQEKLRPLHYGSYASSHEDDSLSYVTTDSSPTSITDKMRHLREELSRLINLLNNSECHKYLLPQICQQRTASKLIIIAQYPLLSEDCANGIAFILRQLFKHNDKVSMMNCVENGLLKTLVRLLDSHVTIQTQAISLLEEILSHNIGDKDYIAEFAELDPDLLLALLQENDLPMANPKLKHNEMYARRLRSLSSPSELGDSLKNGNSYFTKNWSRRLLIRILSRTSYTAKMRGKLGNSKISKQLVDLMSCPTMEIREHSVITLANMALSYQNHDILKKADIVRKLKEQICVSDCISTNVTSYHAARALVYLGETDLPLYIFHDIKGIDEDVVYSNHERYDHLYVKATTLEGIIRYLTNDPKLLWGDMALRVSTHNCEPTTVEEREIIRFTLSLHRTFADTMIFFRLLIHRFSDPNVQPAKRHKLDIPPVHSKVCNVVCIWLEEFPWHFREEPDLLTELEEFVLDLEDFGPVYYDIRDQVALRCTTVQLSESNHILDKVTHLDQYKHCRASLMNEEVPFSVYTVSWLSALRAVIEKPSTPEQPPGFIRSLLNLKERELTSHVKALIPASYRAHPDVLSLTKNLYDNLALQNLSDREWQHLFVEAFFSHPAYKTDLFYEYDIFYDDEAAQTSVGVIVGLNEQHLVIMNRHTHQIIGHHSLTSLQKIQWFTRPLDNVMCVAANNGHEYRLVGNTPSDIEMLITLMVQYMGEKIELVDNNFYLEEEDFSEADRIVPSNRHSWHANTNGYARLSGDCPPTTPCRNSYIDISQAEDSRLKSSMTYNRSRLSLNLSSFGQRETPIRRVHTTNDVTMAETLKLVEMMPRTSLTDRLRSFSTSITSKLDSVKAEEDSDEELLPKVLPNDSLIGPPSLVAMATTRADGPPTKRPIRRSPRISPKTWERGVVRIDPETAQETVIITEKCNVLYQLKSSGASTPSTPDSHLSHLRVRQMSSFKNIDTAAFTKLLTQSMEMIEERKRNNRRNSAESTPSNLQRGPGVAPKHHNISRSKTFSHTFAKLVAASSPTPSVDTPVELEKFTCLREDVNTSTMCRIRKAQENLFTPICDCPDVEHYTPCPCPPHSDLPYDYSFNYRRLDEAQLLSYHREIARQLTIRDHELFSNIAEVDLLEYTRKRDLPIANYPSIMRCKEHFTQITNTVKTMILQCEPRDMRIKILEHFIDISHQCVLLRNFSSLFSIVFSALLSAAILNLSATWAGISPAHRALFDQFTELTLPTFNYKTYRTLLQSSSAPTIPFLQIYIHDFLLINEGNPDYLKKGLINLHKRRLLYRSLEEIRYFQRMDYNITEIPEILTFLLGFAEGFNEDDFYMRSEMLKRTGKSTRSRKQGRRRGYN